MADGRKNHLKPLRQVCREVTVWCKQLALCAGARVAIDGRQGKAVHAKVRHFTADQHTHLRPQIDQRVEGYRKALDGPESEEEAGPPGGAVADHGQAQ
jgi:hypothetical protein